MPVYNHQTEMSCEPNVNLFNNLPEEDGNSILPYKARNTQFKRARLYESTKGIYIYPLKSLQF